jgi:hypothetical protein
MTTSNLTPLVRFSPAPVIAPNLAAHVATAQAAGDLAYAFAVEAGMSLAERAAAYHAAYMRDAGAPMPCSCSLCRGAR